MSTQDWPLMYGDEFVSLPDDKEALSDQRDEDIRRLEGKIDQILDELENIRRMLR